MGVILREVRRGRTCTILAMGSEKSCQLLEFLGELAKTDRNEAGRVAALLTQTAEGGRPKNEEKCRFFKDIRVFELKTRGGVRIMAFWDEGNLIVCSHAFLKKSQKTPEEEKTRAVQALRAYFEAKKLGQVARA